MSQNPPDQPYGQPPHGQDPYGQPPHGQDPYGQPGQPTGQPTGQQPYADQPYGQPYGQQPSGQQPYGAPGHPGSHGPLPKGMAIAALVLGALALLLCWTIVGGILLGLVAVVLGAIASSRAKKGRAGGRGMAITGIVLGILGVVIAGALVALGASLLNSDSGRDLQDCLREAGDDQAQAEQCQRQFQDDLERDLG